MDQSTSSSDQSHSIHTNSLSTSSNVDSGTSSANLSSSVNLSGGSSSAGRRSFNRGRWLKDEDDKLRKLVNLYGDSNWNEISKYFQDRSDIQCQQRWDKVVNPELVKGPWTKEVSYFDSFGEAGSKRRQKFLLCSSKSLRFLRSANNSPPEINSKFESDSFAV